MPGTRRECIDPVVDEKDERRPLEEGEAVEDEAVEDEAVVEELLAEIRQAVGGGQQPPPSARRSRVSVGQ